MSIEDLPGNNIDAVVEEMRDAERLKPGEETSLTVDEIERDANMILAQYSRVPSEEKLKPEDLMANMHGKRILSVEEGRFEVDQIKMGQSLSREKLDNAVKALKGQVKDILSPLTDDERVLMEDRFGLRDGRALSESQIAKERGIPESQVKDTLQRAIQKISP